MIKTTKIYASTVARYNEGKLLDGEKIKRISDASYNDAVKMLCDYGWGGGVVTTTDLDALIARETESLIRFVEEDCPDEAIASCLLSKFLYSNAKAVYKGRFAPLGEAALYPLAFDVREPMESGDYNVLPQPMADAIEALDALSAEHPPAPKTIDIILTRAMYEDMLSSARAAKNRTLVEYTVSEIDLTNLMTVLRARELKLSAGETEEMLIPGGVVDADELLSAVTADRTGLMQIFSDTKYAEIFERPGEEWRLSELETGVDDYLYLLTGKNLDSMLTLDPFLHYYSAQLLEFKVVKMILVCIKNNVRDRIPGRMRCIYD